MFCWAYIKVSSISSENQLLYESKPVKINKFKNFNDLYILQKSPKTNYIFLEMNFTFFNIV